jgi:hypothetical protein
MRGDLRAHGARAQHGSFFDLNHGGTIILNEHSFSKLRGGLFDVAFVEEFAPQQINRDSGILDRTPSIY